MWRRKFSLLHHAFYVLWSEGNYPPWEFALFLSSHDLSLFIHYFYIFTFDKERNKTLHWAFVSFMHFYIFVCKTRIPSRYRITGLGRWGPNGCPLHCTLHPSFHGDCCPTKSVKCYVISLVRIGHVPSEFYFPSSKHCWSFNRGKKIVLVSMQLNLRFYLMNDFFFT